MVSWLFFLSSLLVFAITVPGIAGSILNYVDDNGAQQRIWVRFLCVDREFKNKHWSIFNPSTGETMSLDGNSKIVVPEDRYGIYAVDCLDPDLIVTCNFVCYFHTMIMEMLKWGFEEGKTLFGFGYDFCQINRGRRC
ncbi:lecithin-cholesterol acyltransferase-like 4 [Papaver somniferum]|uniref:lecithin-cholesterol acyltransferase-like 4 n=1 Tax=Papaver somniferum TaxID=3469 RepID=UPI000E700142|nr:lecithin-cholesterol acyltransferase-like 4 [Papaver somniferum]